MGLTPESRSFRFESMANLVLAPGAAPQLVTLFGSQPARLELDTMAEVEVG